MNKYIYLLVLSLSIFIPFQEAHADIKDDWKEEVNKISEQRKDIKAQLQEAEGNQKIKLGMKDNKLAAYQEAYERAISYMEPGATDQTGARQVFSFSPVKLKPGEIVPKEYIPIYKAAGERFGVDWFTLASIHHIETNYSRIKVMVSSVGAIGHMQFMPQTFSAYGIDGNGDGKKDAWNLQDSIYSAANYLSQSGYRKNPRKAIWCYNHADWYVNDVLQTAAKIKASI